MKNITLGNLEFFKQIGSIWFVEKLNINWGKSMKSVWTIKHFKTVMYCIVLYKYCEVRNSERMILWRRRNTPKPELHCFTHKALPWWCNKLIEFCTYLPYHNFPLTEALLMDICIYSFKFYIKLDLTLGAWAFDVTVWLIST